MKIDYIPSTPSSFEVKKWLLNWEKLENYRLQESALNKLFHKTYPLNSDMDEILIKVCALNDFYSTNIYKVFLVAKHIQQLDIDERLKKGDISLVTDIARIKVTEDRKIDFYYFATKYCSHHYAEFFQIYDSYVDKMLRYFRNKDRFFSFRNKDLKDYKKFKFILEKFRNFYKLEYTFKDLDKYLWQLGKKCFPRNKKSNILNKEKPPKQIGQINSKINTADICLYIESKIKEEKSKGEKFLILRAGNIAKDLLLKNRIVMVCNAMNKYLKQKDEVLHKSKNGGIFTTTYEVKYFLEEK